MAFILSKHGIASGFFYRFLGAAGKLLSIMRAMQRTGEVLSEELVCRECGIVARKEPAWINTGWRD